MNDHSKASLRTVLDEDGAWCVEVYIPGEPTVRFGPCDSLEHADQLIAEHGGPSVHVSTCEGGEA